MGIITQAAYTSSVLLRSSTSTITVNLTSIIQHVCLQRAIEHMDATIETCNRRNKTLQDEMEVTVARESLYDDEKCTAMGGHEFLH